VNCKKNNTKGKVFWKIREKSEKERPHDLEQDISVFWGEGSFRERERENQKGVTGGGDLKMGKDLISRTSLWGRGTL